MAAIGLQIHSQNMKDTIITQQEFQNGFGRPTREVPQNIPPKDAAFRHHLIAEELSEYLEASIIQNDIVAIGDALTDLLYVIFGTINEHGFQHIIEDLFTEVHRSNMTKFFKDEDGKPYFKNDVNGKTMKPDDFSHPDLGSIILKAVLNRKKSTGEKFAENRAGK